MNSDLLLVVGLLLACVGLFVANKPRMDVVALLALVALQLCGVISVPEALALSAILTSRSLPPCS
jgi:di/tricarboxylate transporter